MNIMSKRKYIFKGIDTNIYFRSASGFNEIDADALLFINRVLAAGGTVEDAAFVNAFVNDAKYNILAPYWDDLVAAYCPSWGIKGVTTASDFFSITGVATDLIQVVGANQPSIILADLNGRTRLLFDGINDNICNLGFAWGSTVRTIFIGGFEQESWNTGGRVTSDSIDSTRIRQDGVTPQLSLFAGSVPAGIKNSAVVIGTPVSFNGLFAGANAEIRVNNTNVTTGNIGTNYGNGICFGSAFNDTNASHMSGGMFVLLKAVNDANYAAKRTALNNFSKLAYGTP